MGKASVAVRVLGLLVIIFFVVNCVCAVSGRSLGPLPLGVSWSRTVDAPHTIFMFTPPEVVGKPPPEGAKTIPVETYQDLEGSFWSAPSPEYREKGQSPSQFWKDWVSDPSQYGTPKGVAFDIWKDPAKRAKVEAMGIKTEGDLLKVFQTDKGKSQEVCLATGEGFYITAQKPATPGGAYPVGSQGMYTVGFKPFSDLWNPTVESVGIAGLLMEGVTPDVIIESLRKQGYPDSFIKATFIEVLGAHGTNFKPDVSWGEGNLQGWWSSDPNLSDKQPPLVTTIREPTWIEITSEMIAKAGGKVKIPGEYGWYEVTTPVLVAFTGIPPEELFRINNWDIGVLKGGRDLIYIIHGDYVKEIKANKPDLWNKLCNRPSQAIPADILADYADWCVRHGMEWAAVGGTSLPPSKLLQEILGQDYLAPGPSITTAELGLYLKGDSLAQKVFSNPKGVAGLSPEEQAAWKQKVKGEYTEQRIKFMDSKIKTESGCVSYYELRDYVQWLKDMGRTQEAYLAEKTWLDNEAARQSLDPWIERNRHKSPQDLGAVDTYIMETNGRTWNPDKEDWELRTTPEPPPAAPAAPASRFGNPQDDWVYALIQLPASSPFSNFLAVLAQKGFKVSSQLYAVKLPYAKTGKTLNLRFPAFTMALFSPDFSYSSTKSSWSLLGSAQFGALRMDNLWWPVLVVAILAVVLPSVDWQKARRYR